MKAQDPALLADELRERAKKGELTFTKSELRLIAATLNRIAYRCAEAYQVVGHLASDAGVHEDRSVVKAMDLLSDPLKRGNILPFSTAKNRADTRKPKRQRKAPTRKAAARLSCLAHPALPDG
jgi:hypothetical protein